MICEHAGDPREELVQLPFMVPRMLIVKAKTGTSDVQDETSAIVFSHAGVGGLQDVVVTHAGA